MLQTNFLLIFIYDAVHRRYVTLVIIYMCWTMFKFVCSSDILNSTFSYFSITRSYACALAFGQSNCLCILFSMLLLYTACNSIHWTGELCFHFYNILIGSRSKRNVVPLVIVHCVGELGFVIFSLYDVVVSCSLSLSPSLPLSLSPSLPLALSLSLSLSLFLSFS